MVTVKVAGHQPRAAHQGHTINMVFPPSGSTPGLLLIMLGRMSSKEGHHFLLLSHSVHASPKEAYLSQHLHAQG